MTDDEDRARKLAARKAWADARELLRQAYIWEDTRGEPPVITIEIVAAALKAERAEGLRQAREASGGTASDYVDEAHAALREFEDIVRARDALKAHIKDAERWRAFVTTFGPEADVSSPHRPHTMIIAIDTYGCEVREDGRLNFKETLERALDDEIKLQSDARLAALSADTPA